MDNLFFMIVCAILIAFYLFIKLAIIFLNLKYKLNVSFQFERIFQLKNIEITKHEHSKSLKDSIKINSESLLAPKLHVKIDKLWISSCYLNRNIEERFILCINNFKIIQHNNNINNNNNNNSSIGYQSNRNNNNTLLVAFLLKHISHFATFYLTYIGSVCVNKLYFSIENNEIDHSISVDSCVDNFKIETCRQSSNNNNSIKLSLLNFEAKFKSFMSLNTNKLLILFNEKEKILNIEFDKTNINLNHNNNMLKLDYFTAANNTKQNKQENLNGLISCFKQFQIDLKLNRIVFNHKNEIINLKIVYDRFGRVQFFIKRITYSLLLLNNNTSKEKLHNFNTIEEEMLIDTNRIRLLDSFQCDYWPQLNEIQTKCSCFNFYVYDDNQIVKHLLEIISLKNNNNKSEKNDRFANNFKFKRFSLDLNDSYINFILSNDKNTIYKLGATKINYLNESNRIELNLKELILIKSLNKKLTNIDYVKNKNKFLNKSSKEKFFKHFWGNLLNVNSVCIKYKLDNHRCLSLLIDQVFIEYNIPSSLIDYLNSLSLFSNQHEQRQQQNQSNDESELLACNFKLKLRLNTLNVFFLYEQTYFICLQFIGFKMRRKNTSELNLMLENMSGVQHKKSDLETIDDNAMILIKNNLQQNEENLLCSIKTLYLSSQNANDEIYLTVNKVLLNWSFKSHFILNECIFKPLNSLLKNLRKEGSEEGSTKTQNYNDQFKCFKILVETNISMNLNLDYAQDSTKANDFNNQMMTKSTSTKTVYFNSKFLFIESVSIVLSDFYLNIKNNNEFDSSMSEISMFINANDNKKEQFFEIQNFKVDLKSFDKHLSQERKSIEMLCSLDSNRTISYEIDSIQVQFLFGYDFAKLIDHLLNLRKCIYKMHNLSKKEPKLIEPLSTLSYDFILKLGKFKIVIEDDPFEVKLAYNYALMSDEYLESIKRRQTLEQRRLIKENNLESKALELLVEKESKIYVKRSKSIYNTNNSTMLRKELFCICIENVKIYALSDLEWHGRQKCYDILIKIDECSPEPPPPPFSNTSMPQNFSILWCRYVNVNVTDLRFLFRDYTQPFLKITDLNLFGKLLGAEYFASARSLRQVHISVDNDLLLNHLNESSSSSKFTIERNMSPFKFYYDFCSKMSAFNYAYGPCWEGCMAQFNLMLDRIIHPSRDPSSKPLPWWDKSRLFLHGRFTSCIKQMHLIYHVSTNPYNRYENVRLVWNDLYYDWTNMKMQFKGDFDIYLNTESKYDDCRLLHLPNLVLVLDIEWICKAQCYQHYNKVIIFNFKL
jgi:hypothetical protein